MRTLSAIVFKLLAALTSQFASASPDLVAMINGIREQGCSDHPGMKPPLRPDPLLDRVADALASGRSLRDAMTDAGYRAVQSAVLEVFGSEAGMARTLAERGCKDIVDPGYRVVGIAERVDSAWIVMATPLAPPAADKAQAVGRRVLDQVNEARARPRRCGWKRFDVAAPLVLSETLQRAAHAHARDMAVRSRLDHAGGDGSTPGERATRAYRGLDPIDYPFDDRTLTVTRCGRIGFGRRKVNLSKVLAGQNVSVKQITDHIWLVRFMTYDLGKVAIFSDSSWR